MSPRSERRPFRRLLGRARRALRPPEPSDRERPPDPEPHAVPGKVEAARPAARPDGIPPWWANLRMPQLPDSIGATTDVVVITSMFHAVRAPGWATLAHPNRVGGLPGGAGLLVIDASAGDAVSLWAGMGGDRLAVTELVLEVIAAVESRGTATVFRWDVAVPTPGLGRIADRCRHVVAAPGAGWSRAPVIPHGTDPAVFSPPPERRAATSRILTMGDPTGDDTVVDARIAHQPHRLAAVLRSTAGLEVHAPDSPTVRRVVAEATACGVEVAGAEPMVVPTPSQELDRLAELAGIGTQAAR